MLNFDPSGTMYGPVPELFLETGCGVYFFTLLDMFEMLEYLIWNVRISNSLVLILIQM